MVAGSFITKKQTAMHSPIIIKTIPLQSFTPDQVADLLGVSVATVHNYHRKGKRLSNDLYVKLKKEGTRVKKTDLVTFINNFNKDEEIHL
jgi:predicted transcriptional regulator